MGHPGRPVAPAPPRPVLRALHRRLLRRVLLDQLTPRSVTTDSATEPHPRGKPAAQVAAAMRAVPGRSRAPGAGFGGGPSVHLPTAGPRVTVESQSSAYR